jgi:hypothetical protein
VALARATIGTADDPLAATRTTLETDRQAEARLGRCYERALADHPDLDADVDLAFTVLSTGRAADVAVTGSPPLEDCIARAVASWTFTPRADRPRVDHRLKFRRRG